jgi:protein-S-isoprenylcysteine O-methyltransferase Ste14
MFCVLLGTGFLVAPTLQLLIAVILFVAGTEIRVRAEDRLLAWRFSDEFHRYQRSVSAYIPFLR